MSQLTAEELTALKSKAKDVRIDILKMITKANSGHTGGSLSAADILTLLFFYESVPRNYRFSDHKRSPEKGHASKQRRSWHAAAYPRRHPYFP